MAEPPPYSVHDPKLGNVSPGAALQNPVRDATLDYSTLQTNIYSSPASSKTNKGQPPPYSAVDPKLRRVPLNAAPPGPVGIAPSGSCAPRTNDYYYALISSSNIALGANSQPRTCQFCHKTSITRVETQPNSRTHLIAVILCIFICWPCFFLPYSLDSCKSKLHYCGNCGAYLGKYDP